jgi:hypothetical protein
MAVNVKVRNNRQIIVPVRFGRAVTGPPVVDAPDLDDRGFSMGVRPSKWGSTDARGAMVSITSGDTVRLKVIREDLDSPAPLIVPPLFVTSTDTTVITVQGSAGPLAADGIFSIRAVVDEQSEPVKIQVRLGSAEGPVLGEMEPHVFQLRQIRVRAHLVTINNSPTARTAASLVALFQSVNVIWRAAGIEFLYDQAETRNENVINFLTAGQVTTQLRATPPTFAEFSTVLNLNPDNNAINCYFVQNANEFTGLTFDHDTPRPTGYGVVLIDRGNAHELAHELAHFLDEDLHSGENASRRHIRDDIWSERRLTYDFSPLGTNFVVGTVNINQPPHRNDVGYGNLVPGELIAVKNFTADPTDGSLDRNRRRVLVRPI